MITIEYNNDRVTEVNIPLNMTTEEAAKILELAAETVKDQINANKCAEIAKEILGI